jgi:hypothetical protein
MELGARERLDASRGVNGSIPAFLAVVHVRLDEQPRRLLQHKMPIRPDVIGVRPESTCGALTVIDDHMIRNIPDGIEPEAQGDIRWSAVLLEWTYWKLTFVPAFDQLAGASGNTSPCFRSRIV